MAVRKVSKKTVCLLSEQQLSPEKKIHREQLLRVVLNRKATVSGKSDKNRVAELKNSMQEVSNVQKNSASKIRFQLRAGNYQKYT